MIDKRAVLLVLWIQISSIFITIVIIPSSATCDPVQNESDLPNVKIKLLDTSQTAHVGPYDSTKVVFNGTVNVTCKSDVGVLVYLNAQDTWGSADIAPDTFLFSDSGEKAFDVECSPRSRESVTNIGTVTIHGRWDIPGEDISGFAEPRLGVTGIINIAQFYKFTLKSPKPFSRVDPGANELMTLTIQNRGNGKDLFSIKIKNQEGLSKNDFEVTLNQTLVEIPESPEDFTIQLLVEVPTGEYWMSYQEIHIEVTSVKGLEHGVEPQTFRFIVRIEGEVYKNYREYSLSVLTLTLVVLISLLWLWRRRKKKKRESKKNSQKF